MILHGCPGSGILAIFAAKAGAKKVYAVEATNMAKFAKELVKDNEVGFLAFVIANALDFTGTCVACDNRRHQS